MLHDAVKHSLDREVREASGEIALLWKDLNTGETLYAHQPEKRMVSASMIKVPILLTALEEVRRGGYSLDTAIPVVEGKILEDTTVFEHGPGEASLEELLTWMIILSDNTATNALIGLLGYDRINAYCAALGQRETSLQRKMLDLEAVKAGRNNYTSPRDNCLLYQKLLEESILTPDLCRKALSILGRQRVQTSLARYIWENVSIAHKTGGLDHLSHDGGVFQWGSQRWYLGVFMQNTQDIEGDPRRIGRIGRRVLDYYLGGKQS